MRNGGHFVLLLWCNNKKYRLIANPVIVPQKQSVAQCLVHPPVIQVSVCRWADMRSKNRCMSFMRPDREFRSVRGSETERTTGTVVNAWSEKADPPGKHDW